MKIYWGVVEADQTIINEYNDFINLNIPENAQVTEVSFGDYNGYVTSISDYVHLIQVEQLNKGIPAILSIDNKQDVTVDILKNVKEDISALREEISMSRKDTKAELYEKYEYLSRVRSHI
jgi:hypothetical protein